MYALHYSEATSAFVHNKHNPDCRYPMTGVGDTNMYALFAELIYKLRSIIGCAGFIVPTGIATDDSTKVFFNEISTKGALRTFYDFENREKIFPIDSRLKFCLVSLAPKIGLTDYTRSKTQI